MTTLTIRPATVADAPGMVAVINPIIAAGGTTAIETPMTEARMTDWYINGPQSLCCHVAELDGRILGFQALGLNAALPDGWGDIGTFTLRHEGTRGVGSALFQATRAWARAHGLVSMNATIRADNTGGLAFYRGQGFELYGNTPAVPLADGTPVDRLHHQLAP